MKQGWFLKKKSGFGSQGTFEEVTEKHYKDDKLHSINDIPAVIYTRTSKLSTVVIKIWYEKGKIHRINQPAHIKINTNSLGKVTSHREEWFKRGKTHSEIGPAITGSENKDVYFLNGLCYKQPEWEDQILLKKLKSIKRKS